MKYLKSFGIFEELKDVVPVEKLVRLFNIMKDSTKTGSEWSKVELFFDDGEDLVGKVAKTLEDIDTKYSNPKEIVKRLQKAREGMIRHYVKHFAK